MGTVVKETAMIINILLKKEGDLFVTHCLELDIVSTSPDIEAAKREIVELIQAQVDYAFSNENLDYLYHPAPAEAWEEFYRCEELTEERINLTSDFSQPSARFVPPWIIARTCSTYPICHV